MLAVLAVERRPLSRDLLVEMFWGDQDEERARHSLSDALSHVRRVIGRDAIVLGRSEVALAPDAALAVDAIQLADAARAKEHAAVVAMYGGSFLPAVRVAGSASFDHWVERHHRRLEQVFLESCGELCATLARARRWDECGGVALRWLETAPLSVDAALYWLNALKAPGTREANLAALAAYRRIGIRLRQEYAIEPDPALVSLAGSVSARIAEQSPPRAVPLGPDAADRPPAVSAPAAPENTRRADDPVAAPSYASRARRWRAAIGAGLALPLLALAGFALARERESASRPGPHVVAILPFTVRGSADVAYLREGMVDLLSTSLDGAGALRTVDPRALLAATPRATDGVLDPSAGRDVARQFGAGLFVLGNAVAAGDRLRITAALYEDGDTQRALTHATVEGTASRLFDLVDELTKQLLASHPERASDALAGLAALTTTSLPALKAYLQGVTHYRAGRYAAAVDAFGDAVTRDTTFSLAYYQYSNALLWQGVGGWDSVAATARQAVRHDERLTQRARLLVEAYHAFRVGDFDGAERLYRFLVARYPDDVEAWYQLGDVQFHGNAVRGRSVTEARPAFERVLALEPRHRGALVHLLRIALFEGRGAAVDSLVARALPETPPFGHPELVLLRAFAVGDAAARERAIAALDDADDEQVRMAGVRVALFAHDLAAAERITRILVRRSGAREFRAVGHLNLAYLALARGRRREADVHLDSVAVTAPAIAREARALHFVLPLLPVARTELAAMRDSLLRWPAAVPHTGFPMWAVYNDLHPQLRRYLLARLELELGDARAALEHAAQAADARGASDARAMGAAILASIRSRALGSDGAREQAIAALESGRLVANEGLIDAPFGNQASERFWRAELLRELRRDAEALRWYSTFGEMTMDQVVFFAPAALRMAEIEERRGNAAAATRHYRRFIQLWSEGDADLQPLVSAARQRAVALEVGSTGRTKGGPSRRL